MEREEGVEEVEGWSGWRGCRRQRGGEREEGVKKVEGGKYGENVMTMYYLLLAGKVELQVRLV